LRINRENQHSRKVLKEIVVIVENKDTRALIAGQREDKKMVTTRATAMEAEETKVKSNVTGAENWVVTPTSARMTMKIAMRFQACSLGVSN
jgi:hypothetical protein